MALVVGQNSYISVADADVYFSERLNTTPWQNADNTTKEAALIQATTMIDAYFNFYGEKTDPAQPLDWPRKGVYLDGVELDNNTIPAQVEKATCEQALYLLSVDSTFQPGVTLKGFKKAKLGEMEIEADLNYLPSKINSYIIALLRDFAVPESGATQNGGVRLIRTIRN